MYNTKKAIVFITHTITLHDWISDFLQATIMYVLYISVFLFDLI